MHPITTTRHVFGSLRRFFGSQEPRVVRRVGMTCPHGRGPVEVDILTADAGKPVAVLKCSAHEARPPTCDQACRRCVEAVLAPAHAVILYPHDGPFEDVG